MTKEERTARIDGLATDMTINDPEQYLQKYIKKYPDAVPADFDEMMLVAKTAREIDFYRKVGDIFLDIEFRKEIRERI